MLNQKNDNVKAIITSWQVDGNFNFIHYYYFKYFYCFILPKYLRIIVFKSMQLMKIDYKTTTRFILYINCK